MIEARAVVVGVAKGHARVRVIDRQEGCGRCDEPGGCRSVKLAYAIRPPASEFSLPDTLGVQVGDEVTLQMRDGASLRSAMTSYGLGAVLMILGASGGQLVASAAEADVWAVAGAAGGLVAAFIINRILHRSRRWRGSVCAHDFGGLR
jgi:sigma-E factor negative regulatory protein RseC